MANDPYSIYVRRRPQKVAFLVNPKKLTPEQIDRIFDHNRARWGGRYNPVIFTDGKKIEEKWWNFLREIDPDLIKSLVPLSKSLMEKIDLSLSPYLLEVPRNGVIHDEEFHVAENGISILPTLRNVAMTAMSPSPILVIFKLDHVEDEVVKRFVRTNFGEILMTGQAQGALEKVQTKIFELTDVESLAAALTELSSGFKTYIYPIQLSSTPDQFEDVEYSDHWETFSVFIGDSPHEIIGFWNRIFCVTQYQRRHLKQLWLPTDLTKIPCMDDALRQWLYKVGDPSGSGRNHVHFASFTLPDAKLQDLVEKYKRGTFLHITHQHLEEPEFPNFRQRSRFVSVTADTDIFRATGQEEIITINGPGIETDADPGRHWMADVFVQFPPDRYSNFVGKEFWWQFPKKNGFAIQLFGKRAARIKADGFPSVPMSGRSATLEVRLPEEWGIFWNLILGGNNYFYSSDARRSLKEKKFGDVHRSDKGRYLSGLLEIFGSLSFAHQILEERYWRTMFNKLSNQDPSRDTGRKTEIANKLKKEMRRFGQDFQGTNAATDGITWLSEYILQQSKIQASDGKELRFDAFVAEAREELKEFNALPGTTRKWKFNENDVKKALARLTESNLIDIGYRPYCRLCGSPNWFKVDEARQQLECKGCSHEFSLRPEEDHYYRLNSRIQAACAKHGLFPVVLVLGELLHDSKTSFIYMPSLDIFKKRNGPVFSDLDIACTQDGKFIIGEIKMSCALFKQSDFDRMVEIAKVIRPDKVIFSALEKAASGKVKRYIAAIKPQMDALGVEVSWHQISSYRFGPSPVR